MFHFGNPELLAEETTGVPHFSRSLREVGSKAVGSGMGLVLRGRRSILLEDLPIIHFHRTSLAESIGAVTAPVP